jgi:hypothetical protein
MSDSAQPRALALFTDRNDRLAAIDRFLTRLREGRIRERAGVLSFYGVGGVGKTTLREKALTEFRAKVETDKYDIRGFVIANVDLDTDPFTTASPIAQILGRVRNAVRKEGINTPQFDYLYLVWWSEETPAYPSISSGAVRAALPACSTWLIFSPIWRGYSERPFRL